MIIIKLQGGLGNQMFQYAYGLTKSLSKGQSLYYYFFRYKRDTNRKYELGIFDIKGKKVGDVLPGTVDKIRKLINLDIPFIYSGFWQNEKYFMKYEDEIRNDFQFKNVLNRKNTKVLIEIENTDSVSIHVRRGDYINNKKTNEYHGVCSLSYYQRAINYIRKKVKNPKYFIFSDDINWVKENLKIANAVYINWNTGENDYVDMQLMSHCKHNIIANSSFSWWGAWLNRSPDKIVIAPKKWFNNQKAQAQVGMGIVPKKWIRI